MKKLLFLAFVCSFECISFVSAYANEGKSVAEDVAKKWTDAWICGDESCGYYGETSEIVGGCSENNKDCTGKPSYSKTSECRKVTKTQGGSEKFYTCHATSCKDDYWEWYVKKNDNTLVPKGICHPKSAVERCETKCNNCPNGQTCKPYYVNDEKGNEGRGYAGCSCQPINDDENSNAQGDGGDNNLSAGGGNNSENSAANDVCKYTFTAAAKCPNSNKVIQQNTTVTFNKNDVDELDDCKSFDKWYAENEDKFLKNVTSVCEQYGKDVTLDAQTQTAINEVNKFFKLSDSDRTVWRTEEGKFNTARLASDATAGVVLGTVGGIVSGKIIKKKQLEKGFDVLHCTVGGQKTADYGDTFRVTYQR